MYANVEMSLQLLKTNAQEIIIAQQYLHQIEEYEKSENIVVKNIEFCCDSNPEECSANALSVNYSFRGLMGYVSGRDFNVLEMTNEEIRKSFEEKDWDILVEEEQLIFDGDTLYVCVY